MIHVAEATLQIPDWPAGAHPRVLRGAICTELEHHAPGGLHIDWHGHAEEQHREAIPPICYRVHRGPSVYLAGARTEEHLALLLRGLGSLRLPHGDVVEVEGVDVTQRRVTLATSNKAWRRYELETPIYPPEVAWRRRPRHSGPERRAWAGALLRASLAELGLDAHVQIEAMRDEDVEWRGERRRGFVARWVSNADLPDGMGLGAHRAEGWGVVRCR